MFKSLAEIREDSESILSARQKYKMKDFILISRFELLSELQTFDVVGLRYGNFRSEAELYFIIQSTILFISKFVPFIREFT